MSEEYDVIVIGAGPGGYVAAIRCGQLGLKALVIEKNNNLGGTCLNVGCIPSKTLLYYSEQFYQDKEHRTKYGLEFSEMKMNFEKLMRTKSGVIKGLNMGIGGLLKKNKVTHKLGHAQFKSPNEIEIDGKETVKGKHIIIATGSEPRALPNLPFDEEKVISSTGALSLKKVPAKLAVIGAGVIGLELGSVYKRLGSEVVFFEALDQIGGGLDPTISKLCKRA
jgi:dihydrolipoamide dehydrogenase